MINWLNWNCKHINTNCIPAYNRQRNKGGGNTPSSNKMSTFLTFYPNKTKNKMQN